MSKNLSYRLQQIVIALLHFILLFWIHYALTKTGQLESHIIFAHFVGMGLYGALLIRGCAAWGKWHYRKEKEEELNKKSP